MIFWMMDKSGLSKFFRPEITKLIQELKKTGTLAALDELIQLTPAGLFEMMRIRGPGRQKIIGALEDSENRYNRCLAESLQE